MARLATTPKTKKRIAKEITDHLRAQTENGHFVFSTARREWEKRCKGSFDQFVTTLIFTEDAWLKSSYRGQQRHGKGFRNDLDKQFVKLYVF